MQFDHFIITRFCFRGRDVLKAIGGSGKYFTHDPLDPTNLDYRFKLLEMICLPSLSGQTSQDFTWILIIDKQLPINYRKRLEQLIACRERTYLYEYNPNDRIEEVTWLERFFTKPPEYFITTILDDDDALPRTFVHTLQDHLKEAKKSHKLPPVKILGAKNFIQWDIDCSTDTPLGWRCAWHCGLRVIGAGLTLCAKYPTYNICISAIRHNYAEQYLDLSIPHKGKNIKYFRDTVMRASEADHYDLKHHWSTDETFFDLSKEIGPVLMSNHSQNVQYARFYQIKYNSEKVIGPESFSEFDIDWNSTQEYIQSFRKNISQHSMQRRLWIYGSNIKRKLKHFFGLS